MEKIPGTTQRGRVTEMLLQREHTNTPYAHDLLPLEEPLSSYLLLTFSTWLESVNPLYSFLVEGMNNKYHPSNSLGMETNLVTKLYDSEKCK